VNSVKALVLPSSLHSDFSHLPLGAGFCDGPVSGCAIVASIEVVGTCGVTKSVNGFWTVLFACSLFIRQTSLFKNRPAGFQPGAAILSGTLSHFAGNTIGIGGGVDGRSNSDSNAPLRKRHTSVPIIPRLYGPFNDCQRIDCEQDRWRYRTTDGWRLRETIASTPHVWLEEVRGELRQLAPNCT